MSHYKHFLSATGTPMTKKDWQEVDYRPAKDCFVKSDTIRACHLLYEDFQQERTDVHKFTFYLWLQQNEMEAIRGKDENGNLGYGLKFISKQL